ncbi:ATP-binding protein [Streptomyces sp. AK02-01A]|uniref:ATP-binding protein n=1 Tax=Streptomyces sp. AK02-01A TaxID=3028648 RepID=UPI0029AAB8D5|nr:ATP-binding protein [Streptomyces sp. AK02-01A]MDX3855817.1 ATP-binding protein [Streptomyces sp. AK02-01A]
MKKSAVKTLGVAALGAAFAATAAGTASAAPAVPHNGADLVSKTLPVDGTAGKLPAPASDAAQAGRTALATLQKAAPQVLSAVKTANPFTALLGGLPVSGLTKGGVPVNGIPLGG